MCGPLDGFIILEVKPHPHLQRESPIFVDENALLNVIVHDGWFSLGVDPERLFRGHRETGGTIGRVRARVDNALLGFQTKVN